ncbi:hypothetical protein [Enterococcus xiangfangensis]|uniref:hypothetical protein n=1 Tax=Enterococcus xiangfangensis TaxID=1296537 RepID=UPI003D168D16
MDQKNQDWNAKLQEALNQSNSLQATIDSLNNQINCLTNEKNSLQAELDTTKQQLATSNKENSDLKAYIEKLNKANRDVEDAANKSQQIVDQHQ